MIYILRSEEHARTQLTSNSLQRSLVSEAIWRFPWHLFYTGIVRWSFCMSVLGIFKVNGLIFSRASKGYTLHIMYSALSTLRITFALAIAKLTLVVFPSFLLPLTLAFLRALRRLLLLLLLDLIPQPISLGLSFPSQIRL